MNHTYPLNIVSYPIMSHHTYQVSIKLVLTTPGKFTNYKMIIKSYFVEENT